MDELSGGQFVLVNEAVNLGIAIYNMQQGEGIRYETLFRDETVGALDATNAKEYVRMLRRAMDSGWLPSSCLHLPFTACLGAGGSHFSVVGGGQIVAQIQEDLRLPIDTGARWHRKELY